MKVTRLDDPAPIKRIESELSFSIKSEASTSDIPKVGPHKGRWGFGDIPGFYRTLWASDFIPQYITFVGADDSPWDPTFDSTTLIQAIRDGLYTDTNHRLDDNCGVVLLVCS